MSKRRAKRATPSYPRLGLAAAVGLGLAASACGPEPLPGDLTTTGDREQNQLVCCTDAGSTTPSDSEFFGGGAPFELLPDGGVP